MVQHQSGERGEHVFRGDIELWRVEEWGLIVGKWWLIVGGVGINCGGSARLIMKGWG